ncbi:MAG: GAF domain-containing protein [Clostridia bacterium]|nr:GAF domain-containing protein [Clostridia bacterium]
MLESRNLMIEKLTGIHSSKKTYYVELRRRLQEIGRRNLQLEIMNRLAKSIKVNMSLEEMLQSLAEALGEVVIFDQLGLYINQREQLQLMTSYPRENAGLSPVFPFAGDQKLISELRNGTSVVWTDNHSQPASSEGQALAARGIKSAAIIPLVSKEELLGVLLLGSGREDAYTGRDLLFLEQLGDQLVVSIQNARLYNEVVQVQRDWEKTLDAVTDMLIFIDCEHRIVRFNKALPAYVHRKGKEIAGSKCYQVLMERETRCEACPVVEASQTGNRAFHQMRLPRGEILDVFAYPAFDEKGHFYGAILYAKDVTQLVYSSRFVALGEMAAGVAHELNSPLTAILGDAQLLLRDLDPNDPQAELLQDIKNCGFRCKRTIENLLAFSRQEEYKLELVSINQVVERALALVAYQIEKGGIIIEKQLASALPHIWGSPQRLEQVIVNLLLNAKDAVEEGSGPKTIQVSTCLRPTEELAITIADTGRGIAPENLSKIFNPFFTTKPRGKGTGLGLSVSLGIVENHGGRIEVQSREGEGSAFTVVLPTRLPES